MLIGDGLRLVFVYYLKTLTDSGVSYETQAKKMAWEILGRISPEETLINPRVENLARRYARRWKWQYEHQPYGSMTITNLEHEND